MGAEARARYNLPEEDFFFGAISKLSYRRHLGNFVFEPRWKSEFRKQSRGLFEFDKQTSLLELFSALIEIPIMRVTQLQAGVEYVYYNDFEEDRNDYNSLVGAFQFSNESDYLGYRLRALVGLSLQNKSFSGQKSQLTSQSFITIFAGLN